MAIAAARYSVEARARSSSYLVDETLRPLGREALDLAIALRVRAIGGERYAATF